MLSKSTLKYLVYCQVFWAEARCFIVCSEIRFSERLCFIGTSQFISSVQDLTHFCLMWVLTKLSLQTHLRAIFVLCVPFYRPAFDIIYLIVILFSVIDVSSYSFIYF